MINTSTHKLYTSQWHIRLHNIPNVAKTVIDSSGGRGASLCVCVWRRRPFSGWVADEISPSMRGVASRSQTLTLAKAEAPFQNMQKSWKVKYIHGNSKTRITLLERASSNLIDRHKTVVVHTPTTRISRKYIQTLHNIGRFALEHKYAV
jgi:hypothetical protein